MAALALCVCGAAIARSLTSAKPSLTSSNSHYQQSAVGLRLGAGQTHCRHNQYVGPRTGAVHLVAASFPAPSGRLHLVIEAGRGNAVAVGDGAVPRAPDGVLVRLRQGLKAALWPAQVCVRNTGATSIAFASSWSPLNPRARIAFNQPQEPPRDDYRFDFMAARGVSPLAQAGAVARRAALFRPLGYGPWTVWLLLAVAALAGLVAVAATVRASTSEGSPLSHAALAPCAEAFEPATACLRPLWFVRRAWLGLPAVVRCCAVLAAVNGLVWGLVQPPYEGPDEPSHVAYAEAVASGHFPRPQGTVLASSRESFPPAELALLHRMRFGPEAQPSWNPVDGELARREAGHAPADNGRVPDYVTAMPPGFYLLAGGVAAGAGWMNELDREALLRAVSAVLAGIAVGLWLLFVIEALPGAPWAWWPAGVLLAFQPVLGSLGGAITPDTLLFVFGAALLWLLARTWQRGLTVGAGVAIGGVAAAGLLTKPAFVGLLPGLVLGLALLAMRARRGRAVAVAVLSLAIVAAGAGGWLWSASHLLDQGLNFSAGGLLRPSGARHFSPTAELAYLWEWVLPWDPPTTGYHWFGPSGARTWPSWDNYVQGFVGRFGWYEYGFAPWVNQLGASLLIALGGLAIAGLIRARRSLRTRLGELATYGALAAGLFAAVGVAGYRYRVNTGGVLEEVRYLFPLLGLFAAWVVLALRGAGARVGPVVGVGCSALAASWSFSSLLLTLGRFYA